MFFDIEVNDKKYQAKKGETILEALTRNGISVPTLCKMKDFSSTGACRMCVVEVEGIENLVPSCSFPINGQIKIKTHSPRVIKARKTIVELLLANHPDDCLYCIKNGNCELQHLAYDLNIRERIYFGEKNMHKRDKSSPGIERDAEKCILCGRCVRVCEEQMKVSAIDFIHRGKDVVVETTFRRGLNLSSCINCGQCIIVCPTGALYERSHIAVVTDALNNQQKYVVAHFAPSVTVSLAEEFGLKPGKDVSGIISAILKRLGFNAVFETAAGSDFTIMEEVAEFMERKEKENSLPMFSSCCPAWVQFVEEFYPEFIPNLSTTKSPQQILGKLAKTYYAEINNIDSKDIFSVAIMPCTAKKFEIQREEMTQEGISDNDAVLTVREFIRLIKLYGIDVKNIEPEFADAPFSAKSSAGKLLGVSGGTTESFIRTLHFKLSGKEMDDYKILDSRNVKGMHIFHIEINKTKFSFAVVNGMETLRQLIAEIKSGTLQLDYVEVMACEGGCVNGGGQLINVDEKSIKARSKGLYDIDDTDMIKVAHKNQIVLELYADYLDNPLSEKAQKLLHTSYSKKEVFL